MAAQPELLSPEAANRPLPQDDPGQHQQSQPQSQPHHYSTSSSTFDRSGSSWPAGFVAFPSTPTPVSEPNRDRPRANSNATTYLSADPGRVQHAQGHGHEYRYGDGGYEHGRPPSASASHAPARTRAQSASSVMRGGYEAAPLPPGMVYPAPPARPQTSHRSRDGDARDSEWEWKRDKGDWDRDWDRNRDRVRDRDWDRDRDGGGAREKVRDRERADGDWRRDSTRDYDRERDRGRDAGRNTLLAHSPAALARPISLFDSDDDG